MGTRSSKVVLEKRVEIVYQMILDGLDTPQILQKCSAGWGVSTRAVAGYLARARKRILEEISRNREELFAEHIAARRQLRREAKQMKDLRLVSDILRDEAKLLGLYPAERREIDVPSGRAFPVTIVEVVRDPDDDKDLAE